MNPLFPAALLVVALSSGLTAQELLYSRYGSNGGARHGEVIVDLGDLNSDGQSDFAVASPRWSGSDDPGLVKVYSGSDGSTLHTIHGEEAGDQFGEGMARIGNLNGDGSPDLIVGAPGYDDNRGIVIVAAGSDGATIHRISNPDDEKSAFGYSVCAAGDIDADSVPDIAVSAPNAERNGVRAGAIYFFSGFDGSFLRKKTAPAQDGLNYGYRLCFLGDVTGDGIPEIATATPLYDVRGSERVGLVQVLSGADGSVVASRTGTTEYDSFGISLACSKDIDGDQIPDLLVAAPGRVEVLSSTDASLITTYSGDPLLEFGAAVLGTGDLDHDGIPDVAITTGLGGPTNAGEVNVYSSRTEEIIASFTGVEFFDDFGFALAVPDDLDGDGRKDLLIGAPNVTQRGVRTGQVRAYRMVLAGSRSYGDGHPGVSIPELSSVNPPRVDKVHTLFVGNGWSAACTAFLLLGFEEAELPTGWGSELLLTPAITLVLPVPAAGLQLSSPIPNDPLLYGFELFLQALEPNPGAGGGVAFTPGLQLTFGY